jgi:hypothetical protein
MDELDEFLGLVVVEEWVCYIISSYKDKVPEDWQEIYDYVNQSSSDIQVYRIDKQSLPPNSHYCRYDKEEGIHYYQSDIVYKQYVLEGN